MDLDYNKIKPSCTFSIKLNYPGQASRLHERNNPSPASDYNITCIFTLYTLNSIIAHFNFTTATINKRLKKEAHIWCTINNGNVLIYAFRLRAYLHL